MTAAAGRRAAAPAHPITLALVEPLPAEVVAAAVLELTVRPSAWAAATCAGFRWSWPRPVGFWPPAS